MLLLSLTNSNPSMASYYKYSCLLICFLAQFSVSFSGQSNSLDSVPDLERSMYKVIDGFPCVRLLNLSGEIGCANPGRDKVVAPVVRYRDGVVIHQLSTILLSVDAVQSFFNRVATDADFGRNIGGVLVEAESNKEKLKGFSPDEKFPQSKFSPYKNLTYEWNPNGSGIMWHHYNFPVFLLSENNTSILKEVATKNEKNNRSYSQDVAEFDLVMQTTKSDTRDSESCLKAGTCLPLGGYSVWSSLPPIIQSSLDVTKPIILAMGTMDSASFFRDKGLGADSPLSGLVALLAAADALSHSDYLKSFKKQLVFLVLTGETWGFLGSRRFLHELDLQSDAVAGLNDTFIETVLEIGSVGKGFNGGVKNFFVHSSSRTKVANEMFEALQSAQVSLKSDNIKISAANILNPGVPPSSLMSFLNKDSKISGVVLEDFDDMFANGFYHSHLDDISNINSTSIVAAASLVARSLYILATDMQNTKIPDLDSISVNASLVDELLDCLLKCDPGLSCGLVKNYILPTGACPSSYVGVIVTDPSSPPYRGYSSDISRFIWNFLAEKTAMKMENTSLNCQQGCRSESEVCIKAETDNIGVCVKSTTRYVPAFSTRLQYESGSWKLLPPNSTDPMSMADPVWTESNWDVIGLRVYTRQNAAYDRLILLIGLGITGFSYLAIEIFKTIVTKTLKRD
ncbi:nicastrin-like isoform X1 [Chenopodium quinoa]|uniref:nicastrin-like isoform X1 n=1 Tax=Chenopodium quinoa TaxID=63459 RepID=UPI000B785809|nr:nicastrin-like isoform X1 [Chenopodium quinoa]